jgi:glycogen debranching enzyme
MTNVYKIFLPLLFISVFFLGCTEEKREMPAIQSLSQDIPSIAGKKEYLSSPYVTAGDRVYMVGHQDGSFPDLGWHIKGEMGGIWNHPIKLMDGFAIDLIWDDKKLALNNAESFVNYPMANKHTYTIADKKLEIERWQFVPDHKEGLVVQLVINNTGQEDQNVEVLFTGHSDLRPTWLGERTEMHDATDAVSYNKKLDAWIAKDSLHDWYVLFGADQQSSIQEELENTQTGLGASGALGYDLIIPAQGEQLINFTIAGSYTSRSEAKATYKDIQTNWDHYFTSKRDRYQVLASKSKLSIPDEQLQETFEWLKYNSDWMVRTVPETGTGICAGIPDYPWWFGADSEYALKGYMAIGQDQIVHQTIALLDSISNVTNGNGKIVHEVSTNGAVFNDGNINETPQYASLIWEIYRWNGDRAFLEKYFPTIKKGLRWLMSENDLDNNLFPEGFGMMEIHGLDSEMIDVASYTQKAFADAAKIAKELNDDDLAATYEKTAQKLKSKINNTFWSEQFRSYGDFIGTDEQALHLIEEAMVRADTLNKPWAVDELKATKASILANPSSGTKPFVLHHNWVVNTPMETKIADKDKALKALKTAERFVNPFGVFVTGIDRDDSAGSDDGSFKGSKIFSYTGAVMTLPTGVQAVSENNYGRPDKALNYLQRMTRTFSYALPGSMYEVSPDYGMIAQAWNIYSFAVPIVQQFFGIQPMASRKEVLIQPQMPGEWGEASLENVNIQDNRVSVYYSNTEESLTIRATQTRADWSLLLVTGTPITTRVEVLKGESALQSNQLVFKAVDGEVKVRIPK